MGEWSETFVRELVVGDERVEGAFKVKLLVKLLEFDPERGRVRLYVTDICRRDGFDHPAGTLGDASSFRGLPVPGVGFDAYELGWIDLDTFVELIDMADQWLCDASIKLMKEQDWDIYCTHLHAIDWFYHVASHKLEPALTPDAAERARYEAAELAVYRSMDDAIGRMLDDVQEPALSVVVSDHGAKPRTGLVPVETILADAGLLAYVEGTEQQETMYGYPIPGVDWQHTRHPAAFLLRLREPQGARPGRGGRTGELPGGQGEGDRRPAELPRSGERPLPVLARAPQGRRPHPGAVRGPDRRHRVRDLRGIR